MAASNVSQPSFWPGRKWRIGSNIALATVALLATLIMINFIAARHFKQFELNAAGQEPLSPLTLRVLDSLTNKVKVLVFYDRRQPLYSAVSKVLNKFQVRCPKLDIEYVDYNFYPGRAEEIRTTYDFDTSEKADRIIFSCNGKKKFVYSRELSDFDYSGVLADKKIKRTNFKGESLFASALCSVIDPRQIKAYFLEGHREHSPSNTDEQTGFLDFAKVLQENNIAIGRLSLLTNEVPSDCQLLIVANPLNPISESELEKIDRYLNQGGRMLALFGYNSLNTQTGMEKHLADWGVEVGRNWVTDTLQSKSGDSQLVVVNDFSDHPIVRPLRRSRLALVLPRSIGRRASAPRSADAARVTELAYTSPAGAVHTSPTKVVRRDRIPLMVAVEKNSIQGISADRGETRIVVVGESLFLANTAIDYEANRDFARLAVNWLINREILLEGIGPRPIKEYTITMTRSEMNAVRWLLVAGIPGSVLLFGMVVWARRRS